MSFALGFMLAAVAVAKAPEQPDIEEGDFAVLQEYVRDKVAYEMKRRKVVGLSLAVVDGQEIVWAEGFGWADEENQVPATADTMYRVGSVSKPFTALAVMQLHEQERLDVDAPLSEAIPDFAIRSADPDAPPVTPRAMMCHESGLPSDRFAGWTDPEADFSELPPLLVDDWTTHPPYTVWSYSNLGYSLLGRAVEVASGTDFEAHLEEAVLRPMGMANASFAPGEDVAALIAHGYRRGKPEEDVHIRDIPAGMLQASVSETAHLLQMLFADGAWGETAIVKPETLAEMLTPHNAEVPLDLDLDMGLGFFLAEPSLSHAGRFAGHQGDTWLFHAAAVALLEHDIGVVVLANTDTSSGLVGTVANELAALTLAARRGIPLPLVGDTIARPEDPPSGPIAPGMYQGFAGRMAVEEKGKGRLATRVAGLKVVAKPAEPGLYDLRLKLLGIPVRPKGIRDMRIYADEVGEHQALVYYQDGARMLLGVAIDPQPITEAWRDRLGVWAPVDEGTRDFLRDVRLTEEDGILVGRFRLIFGGPMALSFALDPVSDDLARNLGFGRNVGETVQAIEGPDGERLVWSGVELHRVK
jgi:CubicO group peptidase (beta-lactamase class C family)